MGELDNMKNKKEVPEGIKGWSWGAFGLNWIWGIGNNTYIALLALIPIVGLVMIFILGAKGNEWAWQNRNWESIEDFKNTQRKWRNAWLIMLAAILSLVLIGVVLAASSGSNNSPSAYQSIQSTTTSNLYPNSQPQPQENQQPIQPSQPLSLQSQNNKSQISPQQQCANDGHIYFNTVVNPNYKSSPEGIAYINQQSAPYGATPLSSSSFSAPQFKYNTTLGTCLMFFSMQDIYSDGSVGLDLGITNIYGSTPEKRIVESYNVLPSGYSVLKRYDGSSESGSGTQQIFYQDRLLLMGF